MRTVSLKRKLLLFTGSLFLGIVAILIFIVIPSISAIGELGDEIAQTESYLEDQYLRSQRMQRSIRELEDIEKDVMRFNNITVPPGNDLELITGLEALATVHNISQNLDITYTEQKQFGRSGYYTISFLNHGTYADHIAYLRTLEELPYYVEITKLSWERRAVTEDGEPRITLTFVATIYASAS